MGKDPATISRWHNNHAQPSVETFTRIADILDVDIKENDVLRYDRQLLTILLKDNSTKQNIIWATDN
jgi:transcriptional regulator with XRE-family HTH domain